MDFNTFKAKWLGQRIDYDGVFSYQCVDLILEYIKECYGISGGVWGNAIDYWNHPSISLLEKFSRIGGNDAQQGDIIVFNGNAGNPYGHIGIATGNIDGVNVEILEQNGATGGGTGTGGDAIRTRAVSRSRVAGLLRPIQLAAAPAPAPLPVQKFQVVETFPGGKQIKLNKQPTNLWGMNYDFEFMKDHPVEVHNAGEIWTVTNKVHHVDGYDYYRRDGQVDGFNVADCDDYTPPPPPPPPAPPSAPLPIPTSTTPYQVVKTIKGYGTSNTAINDVDAKGTVEEGIYYIFNRRLSVNGNELLAVNVTKTPGRAGSWINVKDNVVDPPPPPPEPIVITGWSQHPPTPQAEPEQDWRTSYVTFKDAHGNPAPRKYIAMKDLKVVDYEMKRSDQDWHQYKDSEIAGTFIKDNVRIARPQFFADKYLWLGVPEVDPVTGMPNIELYEEVYNAKTTAPERKVLRTQTTIDHIGEIKSILEKDFQRVFDIVKPKKRK